jgi:hypothetical protein
MNKKKSDRPMDAPLIITSFVNVGYERLFNLGNFDHEKFTISKEVVEGSELVAYKKLSVAIVELEEDLAKYRQYRARRHDIAQNLHYQGYSDEQRADLQKEAQKLDQLIQAFETKHKPVSKACKCYYCTHVNEAENTK